ncbi:acyl-CoA dehydrogenase family protein [Kitasatospora purpeofusca]|uniref:acyl-CoA dehydrogenase family protein n=1 Tax=Kitasatospora purpeofusca TaxID=67352 RepID=UPI0035D8D5EA
MTPAPTARPAPPPTAPARPALPPPDLDGLPALTAALAERAAEHDRDATFPAEGIALVHRAGLLTATVAERHGGPGRGLADTVRILRALGAGDPAVALVTAMTLFVHAAEAREAHWPAGPLAQLLAESAERPTLVNHVRVEPELGTPVRGGLPATVAERRGDEWVLTGRKIFSTGAPALRWLLVWARTDEPEPRVGSFLVRGDLPGITVEPTWDHLGLRASRSDDVLLDAVRVPLDHTARLAAPSPEGGRDPVGAAWNSLGLAALYLGVARAAQSWLTTFLHERTPSALGAPLASLPRFQSELGLIDVELGGAERLVAALAAAVDAGEATAVDEAPGAKLLGTRAAVESVQRAVALVGNHGLTRHHPLQRHLRDVLCARVHTPQDDSVLLSRGRAALHRPPVA